MLLQGMAQTPVLRSGEQCLRQAGLDAPYQLDPVCVSVVIKAIVWQLIDRIPVDWCGGL